MMMFVVIAYILEFQIINLELIQNFMYFLTFFFEFF